MVKDIKSRGNHLSTGFLGTPYLCHVLSENGHTNVAYDLLFQETYPSWFYPASNAKTTAKGVEVEVGSGEYVFEF